MMKKTVWVLFVLVLALASLPAASKAAPLKKFSWRVEYYNNPGLYGHPASVRFEDAVSHNWGFGSPGMDIQKDHFSARWTVTRHFEEGTYLFRLSVDDGARVWLNGELIIDAWNIGKKTNLKAEVYIEEGDQQLQVAYFENTGKASINFEWLKLGGKDDIVGAWQGEYYINRHLEGNPALVRQDGKINYDWNSGAPDPRITRDNFSVRWTNTLYLRAGHYTLRIQHDDGMRIFVDGKNVYDAWYDQGVTYQMRKIYLKEGNHTFIVEYYEHLGNAVAHMKIEAEASSSYHQGHDGYEKMAEYDYHRAMDDYEYDHTPHRAAMVDYSNDYHHHPPSTSDDNRYGPASASGDYIIVSQASEAGHEQVTIVDNKSANFYWGGQMNHRRATNGGHGTGFFWTYNTSSIPVDYGEWRPNLKAGQYEVFVYVPSLHATTRKARYQIYHSDGSRTDRIIDQSFFSDEWVSLGTYYFDGSGGELIRLYDGTGEIYGSTYVAFDAIKFVRR